MGGRQIDHEKFVRSNDALARAEENDRKDKFGSHNVSGKEIKRICGTCNRKKHCKKNKVKVRQGCVSVSQDDAITTCEEWTENKKGVMTEKQQKSLLKKFKKMSR